jgi:hypothetical protein
VAEQVTARIVVLQQLHWLDTAVITAAAVIVVSSTVGVLLYVLHRACCHCMPATELLDTLGDAVGTLVEPVALKEWHCLCLIRRQPV